MLDTFQFIKNPSKKEK